LRRIVKKLALLLFECADQPHENWMSAEQVNVPPPAAHSVSSPQNQVLLVGSATAERWSREDFTLLRLFFCLCIDRGLAWQATPAPRHLMNRT
jgi:hypothetical protein